MNSPLLIPEIGFRFTFHGSEFEITNVSNGNIRFSAVRGGTIVGDHEVIFAGQDEVIEFKHTAYSKAVFGKGAVEAAKFLAWKPAGRYDMSDVIQL